MYAIIEASGGQLKVRQGDLFDIDLVEGGEAKIGKTLSFDKVLLIAGEEEWWGDPCFWIETWTDAPGRPPETVCALMSYAIFDDSLAIQHMQLYQRKSCSGVNDDGLPKCPAPSMAR